MAFRLLIKYSRLLKVQAVNVEIIIPVNLNLSISIYTYTAYIQREIDANISDFSKFHFLVFPPDQQCPYFRHAACYGVHKIAHDNEILFIYTQFLIDIYARQPMRESTIVRKMDSLCLLRRTKRQGLNVKTTDSSQCFSANKLISPRIQPKSQLCFCSKTFTLSLQLLKLYWSVQ